MATALKQDTADPTLDIDARGDVLRIRARGDWRIDTASRLEALVAGLRPYAQTRAAIDMSAVSDLDTVGAWLLYRLERRLKDAEVEVEWAFGADKHERLVAQVRKNDVTCQIEPPEKNPLIAQIEDIGLATEEIVTNFGAFLSFVGQVVLRLLGCLRRPGRLRLTPLVHQMEQVGLRSMPIVGLISFLIGAVIVNQGAIQLKQFGAEILVADLVAIGVLRELGILLTAIIIAGRSGSAFTAQIGSMILNEEVDAMKTLGINPIDVLVLPRLLAMVLVLPLLTFFADVMGLLGGALMAWSQLDITPNQFIGRMEVSASLVDLTVGLIKALFFAGVISITGCFEGLKVEGGADSVGRHTTASVVQSIFLVIVLDAFFAVFFTAIGWTGGMGGL